jgi:hypothetical protein
MLVRIGSQVIAGSRISLLQALKEPNGPSDLLAQFFVQYPRQSLTCQCPLPVEHREFPLIIGLVDI